MLLLSVPRQEVGGFRPASAAAMSGRPTADELQTARALIARLKAADSSIKKADELLICAAVAYRAGEFGGVPTECARRMGKVISRPSQVTNWATRLAKLEQTSEPSTCSSFLVQPEWIKQRVPAISELTMAAPLLSPGKRHAKRVLEAVSSTPLGSIHRTSAVVEYTLPPPEGESDSAAKRRVDRHRRREEGKLRSLDLSGATEAHAAAEAERQRLARSREHDVSSVLDSVIVRLERQIRREEQANAVQPWRCPAGCTQGQPCGRLSFRLTCIPSRADVQAQQWALWKEQHPIRVFVSEWGNAFVGQKQEGLQRQAEYDRDKEWAAQRASSEISDSELDELQRAFLSMWDGRVAPGVWLKRWLQHGDITTGAHLPEYRGTPLQGTYLWAPTIPMKHPLKCDRFGPDHHPVGPSACARRGCGGCCVCTGLPLPVYLEICILDPPVWSSGMICDRAALEPWARARDKWITVEELKRELHLLHVTSFMSHPKPAYLLGRDPGRADGRVICLPGDVRNHIPAVELEEWAERLRLATVCLEILPGASRECNPDADTKARISAYLALQAQAIEQQADEWECVRVDMLRNDKEVARLMASLVMPSNA